MEIMPPLIDVPHCTVHFDDHSSTNGETLNSVLFLPSSPSKLRIVLRVSFESASAGIAHMVGTFNFVPVHSVIDALALLLLTVNEWTGEGVRLVSVTAKFSADWLKLI